MFANKKLISVVAVCLSLVVVFSAPALAATNTLKIAIVSSSSSPDAIGARWMKQKIESATNGDIEVKIFADAALGGEIQMLQALQGGTIQGVFLTAHSVGNVVPTARLFLLPFAIQNRAVANRMYDSDFVIEKIWKKLDEKGIVYNGVWSTGFRGFHTSKGIVHGPADVKGLKMRVPQAPQFVKVMAALGANPTPISWSEIYTALSQKVVDGTDTTQYYSWTQKLYEVVPHITVLGQQSINMGFYWNKSWLQSLPAKQQALLREIAWEMADWQRKYQEAADVWYDDNLRANGATIYYPTEKELAVFRELTKDVPKEFYETYGKDDVEAFLAEVRKVRAEVDAAMMPGQFGASAGIRKVQ
jgi:tripartite ATP-independent transporter DctP family solute receptor